MNSLYDRFQALTYPVEGGYVGFLFEDTDYILARDHEGHPAFFVRHEHVDHGRNQTYKLEGLAAVLHYEAVVSLGDQVVSGVFALIRCSSEDETTKQYFVELCEALSRLVGRNPTAAQIDEGINTFVRMFALRRAPSKCSLIGLLGELLFIDQYKKSPECISAWHISPNDSLDFVFPDRAVEVKSTTSSSRLHVLTFEQASGLPGRQLFFLSIQIMPVANGMSGRQLLRRIVDRCGADLAAAMRVWEVAAETLGSDIQAFLDFVFAYEAAVQSMQYFDAADVPAIRGHLPAGVSRVQFVSDFSLASQISGHGRGEILALSD